MPVFFFCCGRSEGVAPRKLYRVVIFSLCLTVICTIHVFRQFAASLHHFRVFSRPLTTSDIKELLDNPISVRQLHDKLRTVNKGRAVPPLANLINHTTKTERYTRHFCVSQYEEVDWLAGYETINKLNYLPCSSSANKHDMRNKQSFLDFSNLSKSQTKHSKPQNNLQNLLRLKLFWKQQMVGLLLDAKGRKDITRKNERVK